MSGRTDLKVGFACNNRCVFCAQGDKRHHGQIPAPVLMARMRETFRPGRGIVFTGGEPTLRKDLVSLVAAARGIGYASIQIQTNGRLLCYPELVERLVRAGVTEISPALHGPSAAVHDGLTRAPGSFEQTVRGVGVSVAAGLPVITNTVVQRGNLACLPEIVELLADLGVRQAQLALVHPVGTAAERFDEVVPRLEEAAPAVAGAVRAGRARGLPVVVEALPLCLARGIEEAVVEDRIPETTVVDLDTAPFSFSTWRREEGKAKGPPCEGCARAAACEGPWREYPAAFGWASLAPFGAAAG